jgi:NAD(P)-dependent dehydrogenase (short-subunit alcohol dehydrogenase family)
MKRPIAVVTGAGQGIGAGIARRLAKDGYEVVVLEVDLPRAEAIARELDGRALACDVSDFAQVEAAAAAIGPVQVLVNNAAVQVHKPILDCTAEELARVVQVNLLGVIYGCKAFAPGMMANGGGSIVSISSAAAPTAAVGHASYPAAKAGVDTLTRQLAQDWGHAQVRVNAVAPGAIQTERNAHRFQGEIYEERLARIPLRRTGLPADIADVVSALCSHDMRYVTGQVIYVDGGMSAGAGRGR